MAVPDLSTTWSAAETIDGSTVKANLLDEYIEYVSGATRVRLDREHVFSNSTAGNASGEGIHRAGECTIVKVADTTTIAALTPPDSGALAFDTDKQDPLLRHGSAWLALAGAGAFRVHKNGAGEQTIPANTYTLVTFSAADFDANTNFDLANEWYLAPYSGIMQFTVSLDLLDATDEAQLRIRLFENNGVESQIRHYGIAAARDGAYGFLYTCLVKVTAGYKYYIKFLSSSEVDIGDSPLRTHFEGYYIAPVI